MEADLVNLVRLRLRSAGVCRGVICLLCGLFLCVATTQAEPPSSVTLAMNEDAGNGNWLIVTLKLEDGGPLPVILDTGSAITFFDDSLKSKLGTPLGTAKTWTFGKSQDMPIYAAPKLFAGDKVLKFAGSRVYINDCKSLAASKGQPALGILGMDVLNNYCVQLDFQAKKIRISDQPEAGAGDLGQSFDLFDIGDGRLAIKANLMGAKEPSSLIDSGFNGDGWLPPRSHAAWADQAEPSNNEEARSPDGRLGGEVYHDLNLDDLGKLDKGAIEKDQHGDLGGIGLGVLSQNLVTLDLPRHKLYLKRTSDRFLERERYEETAKKTGNSAAEFLRKLNQSDQLPGWTKTDDGGTTAFHLGKHPLEAITLDSRKAGSPDVYHYTLTRPVGSDDDAWKLMKAWRTDENDRKIEEYPTP